MLNRKSVRLGLFPLLLILLPVAAGGMNGREGVTNSEDGGTEDWGEDGQDAEVYGFVEQGINCRKGCQCGNSCIDCSKNCKKGSSSSGGCSFTGF